MTLTIAALITAIQFWLRLATFLHGPLKSFLLHVLHDPSYNGLPQDPQKLYQALSTPANRKTINDLKNGKNGKKKVLQQDQVDALLPPTGNATDSSQFDVTLICILIINFTNLPAPLKGWKNKNPPATDLSIGAFVIRAREWRNYIHHTDPDKINQTEFNQKWMEGEQIINNLGFTYDTMQLKTMSLDLKYEKVVKSMYLYLERKQETLSKQQMALAAQHTALDTKHTALDTKHTALATQHTALDTKHTALDTKHTALDTKQTALDTKQTALDTKQTTLDTKQTALDSKQTALADKQAALENQHKSLDNQQASLSQDVTDLQISTTQKLDDVAQQLSLHQNLSLEEIKSLTKRLEEIANVQQRMCKNLSMMKHHSGKLGPN
ncbi:protein Daple-like [Clytia hemisphaerica]|uniref:protein Daple-like n=1 Tax=Clytia hemisphaerica TaxID=252671 RepID=UPI0034D74B7B